VQITPVTPVARAVGSNRIVTARAIVHPLGDPELPAAEEKVLRRQLVMQALAMLQTEGTVG
jgi:glycine reductase